MSCVGFCHEGNALARVICGAMNLTSRLCKLHIPLAIQGRFTLSCAASRLL
jgi:hypothetical protein